MLRQLDNGRIAAFIGIMLLSLLAIEAVRTAVPAFHSVVVAQDEAPDAEAPVADENMLVWTYNALGLRYTIAFLGISFAFVALLIMNMLSLRRDSFIPQPLIDGFEALCNEKKYQEAYEMAKTDESFLGHMLSAGLSRLSKGYDYAIEGMQEVGEEENMKLEHRLSYIAMIGTLAPMVGLLGTVDGMIASFSAIASSPTTPKPSVLAVGISTALVTTLVGLLIAIPAIAVFNIFKNRIARMVLETGIVGENLMSRFETVAKK